MIFPNPQGITKRGHDISRNPLKNGAPGRIRTSDRLVRRESGVHALAAESQSLYVIQIGNSLASVSTQVAVSAT